MDDMHLQSVVLQPAGGLQAEQATADHHRGLLASGVREHPFAVVEAAEAEHP